MQYSLNLLKIASISKRDVRIVIVFLDHLLPNDDL
jgi:hypothetical protein